MPINNVISLRILALMSRKHEILKCLKIPPNTFNIVKQIIVIHYISKTTWHHIWTS